MKLLGFEISRVKKQGALQTVDNRGWYRILESFTGAWQNNVEVNRDTVLTYSAVYACVSLISQDIGKMRVKLMQQMASGIWKEFTNAAHSPVLRKPNHYQTRVKFFEWWITSKLIFGNTYALKNRDQRGVVTGLYILDPSRVTVLVAPGGDVFYKLATDHLSGLEAEVIVPAREIIHDIMIALFHPLVGVSPIFACGLAATQGVNIQTNSTNFFGNMSRPSGILTAPGAISNETAVRLKTHWDENYKGEFAGKVAVLGDGLKYEPMSVNAVDSQLIEQLKWTAENVCTAFHVPPYKIGIGPMPAYNNIEALNQEYYSQCLQSLIESAEICLDEGLELPSGYGTEFDVDALLRMDTATRYKAHSDAIGGGWLAPNEVRRKEDLDPVEGGDTPYLQVQNYSLAALNKRDQAGPPVTPGQPTIPAPSTQESNGDGPEKQAGIDSIVVKFRRRVGERCAA